MLPSVVDIPPVRTISMLAVSPIKKMTAHAVIARGWGAGDAPANHPFHPRGSAHCR